jgi:pyruvate dehydrogenase E1 component alpha subunit
MRERFDDDRCVSLNRGKKGVFHAPPGASSLTRRIDVAPPDDIGGSGHYAQVALGAGPTHPMALSAISHTELVPRRASVVRVMRDDGTLDPGRDPGLEPEQVVKLFQAMLKTRLVDDRLFALQRQGRIGFHVGAQGEEAAVCAATYALRDHDWVFPCYREQGAALVRGFELQTYLDNVFGNARDVGRGRQMPDHITSRKHRYASVSSPVGTQITQAVGFAWAAKLRGDGTVALVYFGEGATSSSDFHGGLNFAGVYRAPVVFFCRNNGWAISAPSQEQTASSSFAVKAEAYGMPGVRVDGNDVFAVVSVVREAVRRAARGEGPTLVEAVTYRTGGHSTSDDPDRYRPKDELAVWLRRDPIDRLRRHLELTGGWSPEQERRFVQEVDSDFRAAVASAESVPPPPLESMFDDVYAALPWHLREQRDQLLTGPRPARAR